MDGWWQCNRVFCYSDTTKGKGVSITNIADRIQTLRKTKGISQEDLADKIGVSRQAVSKWESEQSVPDLEKVILLSDFFHVTTDYLLKGIEPIEEHKDQSCALASRILYIVSTAFLVIGLLSAFSSWYEEQAAECIWGSMIIQAVGAVGYFIGKSISKEKSPFLIRWLNLVIAFFMPVSLLVAVIFSRAIAPYPTDLLSSCVFAGIYGITTALLFFALKKHAN